MTKGYLLGTGLALILMACSPATQSSDVDNASVSKTETKSVAANSLDAKTLSQVKGLISTANSGRHGYVITESLTTEIGPRQAGSEAEARARDWAVKKFKSLGLENVRVEPFTIPGWKRGLETAQIISPYPQPLLVTALGGSVATPENGFTGPVAYFPTFEDLQSAPETGLDGKIVFISGRMDKAPDGAGYGPANRKRRSGATEAAKRGALAVVIRSVGTDSHRFPHTGQMRYSDEVKNIPIGALSAPDADQLERILVSGEEVTLNLLMTPEDLGELASGNVMGDIIGSERPDEIVLISGHLDSWDAGTGAIDDGAGIGISAGAAQVIIDSGLKPKRTIRVVAFGAEENGLHGGYAYAEAHADNLQNHMLATESDFGAERVYEVRSGVKGASGEAVLRDIAAVLSPLGVTMGDKPTNGGPDIGPMFSKGVPAMRLQQDGTDYFDFHHTADDTFDKIDPKAMAQNVAAFAAMAWIASESDSNFRD